jgi:S1-C subfamily serine protease
MLVIAVGLTAVACSGGDSSASSSSSDVSTAAATDGASTATDLQQAYVSAIHKASPSIVLIQSGGRLGSGVIFDTRGDIVTNAHVVGRARRFLVTLASGARSGATVVGSFPPNDVAVIRIAHAPAGLRPASFGDSSRLAVGDIVLAVGNPLGLRSSVTNGIVSALNRTVTEPTGAALPDVIQTSAPINPGNSGGALVSLSGNVVGIPTLAATDPQLGGGAAPGIGFAIPANTVHDLANQIIHHGHVVNSHRAFLGVELAAITARGVLVAAVQPGGPAAKAGITARDVITAINGRPTPTVPILQALMASMDPGQHVTVELITPSGATRSVGVTLGQLPG